MRDSTWGRRHHTPPRPPTSDHARVGTPPERLLAAAKRRDRPQEQLRPRLRSEAAKTQDPTRWPLAERHARESLAVLPWGIAPIDGSGRPGRLSLWFHFGYFHAFAADMATPFDSRDSGVGDRVPVRSARRRSRDILRIRDRRRGQRGGVPLGRWRPVPDARATRSFGLLRFLQLMRPRRRVDRRRFIGGHRDLLPSAERPGIHRSLRYDPVHRATGRMGELLVIARASRHLIPRRSKRAVDDAQRRAAHGDSVDGLSRRLFTFCQLKARILTFRAQK